jgi:hypothetical protein
MSRSNVPDIAAVFTALVIVLPACSASAGRMELAPRADSLFVEHDEVTEVGIWQKKPRVYYGLALRTIDVADTIVRDKIEAFGQYEEIFRYIHSFRRIRDESIPEERPTYLFEARAAMMEYWGIVQVEKAVREDDGSFFMYMKQVTDSALVERYRPGWPGLFLLESHDLTMRFSVRSSADGKTKAGFTAIVKPDFYVPGWLYKLASRKVFPRFIEDLENAVTSVELPE